MINPYLAPSDTNDIDPKTYLVVTTVICSLSVAGALGIILPFVFSPSWRRLRHRLILGLALSDLATALDILCTTTIVLAGGQPENNSSCNTAGFIYLIAVYGSAGFTLSIAVCTYALLMHPLSRFVEFIGRPLAPLYMGVLFWGMGALITGIGFAVYGFRRSTLTNCFFGQNSGQFQNLVLLLPRVIVFAVVILLYLRLFVHFRAHPQNIVVSDFDETMPTQPPEDAYSPLDHDGSRRGSASNTTESSKDSKQNQLFGAWSWSPEHGSDHLQKALVVPPISPKHRRPLLRHLSSRQAPLTTTDVLNGVSYSTEVAWSTQKHDATAADTVAVTCSSTTTLPAVSTRTSSADDIPSSVSPQPQSAIRLGQPQATYGAADGSPLPSAAETAEFKVLDGSAPIAPEPVIAQHQSRTRLQNLSRATTRSLKSARSQFPELSESLSLALSRSISRPRAASPALSQHQPAPASSPRAPPVPSAKDIVAAGDAARRRASHRGLDSASDGMLGVQAALLGDGRFLEEGPRSRRMSAEEMNRKASILMMLYPAAYIVLFSVSIARLALSKWLIYANGFVDCLIFIFVEGGIRRFLNRS